MGNIDQLNFIKQNSHRVIEPVIEIGSKDYGNTPNFRLLFPDYEYIGVDMENGKGVDIVSDFTDDFNVVSEKLGGMSFKTAICFSVLEHCKDPFKACDNISRLLDKDGILFVSVPFSWRIHGYPSDYWRFTPDGIKVLFPEFDFDIYPGNLSTSRIGKLKPIDNHMCQTELNIRRGIRAKQYGYFTA